MVVSYRQPVHTTSALLNAYTDAGGRDDTDDDGDADVNQSINVYYSSNNPSDFPSE